MDTLLLSPASGRMQGKIIDFLAVQGLDWDPHIESAVVLVEEGEILATGSRHGNVLKCIAVAPGREGEGLTATVVTALIKDALASGHVHLFLFTKPETAVIFRSLGFYPVAETTGVVLLENRRGGVQNFVASLSRPEVDGPVGAVVANCNPFTLGHRYLVETAAAQCALVHLFILSEDRSAFDADTRLALARQGTEDIANVVVHPTGDYLISSATFPDYFLKEKARAQAVNCALDLAVFARCFAEPLGITRRYVGTEPADEVTREYNRQMRALLPGLGVQVIEVPRCEAAGGAVSASRVRALLAEGRLEELRPLVPPSTYVHLLSLPRP